MEAEPSTPRASAAPAAEAASPSSWQRIRQGQWELVSPSQGTRRSADPEQELRGEARMQRLE
eukprot:15431176-Alexandrium_andersonii.AAC.1